MSTQSSFAHDREGGREELLRAELEAQVLGLSNEWIRGREQSIIWLSTCEFPLNPLSAQNILQEPLFQMLLGGMHIPKTI